VIYDRMARWERREDAYMRRDGVFGRRMMLMDGEMGRGVTMAMRRCEKLVVSD